MKKEFIPLYEILTGQKLDINKFIEKEHEGETEYYEYAEEEEFAPSTEEEIKIPEVEIKIPEDVERKVEEQDEMKIPEIEIPVELEEKKEEKQDVGEKQDIIEREAEPLKLPEGDEEKLLVEPVEIEEPEEIKELYSEHEYEEEKEEQKEYHITGMEIPESEYGDEEIIRRVKLEDELEEKREEIRETEEIITEEFGRRKIVEKLVREGEGEAKKIVEGEEDIRRKILVEIGSSSEDLHGERDLHEEEKKGKIEVMGDDKFGDKPTEGYEKELINSIAEKIKRRLQNKELDEGLSKGIGTKDKVRLKEDRSEEIRVSEEVPVRTARVVGTGGKLLIQEIIDRIRSDIISKAEIEAKKRIDEAERKAREIIDDAYREAEKIINDAVSRSIEISREVEKKKKKKGYEKGFEQGYKEGERKGYEDAFKKTLSEGRYAIEMFRKIMDEVAYAKERFSDDFPKIVLHLTLVALKTILMTEKLKDEELIVRVLRDALDKVKDFKIVKIRVNEADYGTVRKFFDLPDDVEIIPDPTVEKGDVKIEMREGYFESSMKWREEVIEDVLRSELSAYSEGGGQTKQTDMTSQIVEETSQKEQKTEVPEESVKSSPVISQKAEVSEEDKFVAKPEGEESQNTLSSQKKKKEKESQEQDQETDQNK